LSRRKQIVVGVNRFQLEAEPPVNVLRIDPALEQAQIERVRALRERRDAQAVSAALTSWNRQLVQMKT
jgi:methylmalonyl-CoA mutase N-terminal domain/subunit